MRNEYQWAEDGTDGLRSYSYNASNPAWNYTTQSGTDSDGAYTFSDSSTGQPFARRGNLYNWTAATLGSSFKADFNQQATDSICPRGWQLPIDSYVSADKAFSKLLNTYNVTENVAGWNRITSKPLEYLPTGRYNYSGYVDSRTTRGDWWSGTLSFNNGGYYLGSPEGRPMSGTIGDRNNGFARRCGMRQP